MSKNSYDTAGAISRKLSGISSPGNPATLMEIDQIAIAEQFQNRLEENCRYLSLAALDIAKRFANGATMWSCAPNMSAHAFHVAVEFVHPVVIGKRALPAQALISDSPVDELRQCSRKGDIFVGIGTGNDPTLNRCMLRAQIYGLTSIWIASGPRPEIGSANHVIWLDEDADYAGFLGNFILIYHLLWELTHVCFEHPGLLEKDQVECSGPACITCSDQGLMMEVVDHNDSVGSPIRKARGPDGIHLVDTSLVGTLQFGNVVLVHGDSVISVLEQQS